MTNLVYTIDLVDFYTVPPPYSPLANFLDVVSYGADPTGQKDSTQALVYPMLLCNNLYFATSETMHWPCGPRTSLTGTMCSSSIPYLFQCWQMALLFMEEVITAALIISSLTLFAKELGCRQATAFVPSLLLEQRRLHAIQFTGVDRQHMIIRHGMVQFGSGLKIQTSIASLMYTVLKLSTAHGQLDRTSNLYGQVW